ncbi:MAG: PSD1 and planctomycete cytochrome C domain-containing protein, partial [Planctomycetota bacterium]
LSETCFTCHGPDQNKRKAELRLDTNEGLHALAGGPKVIVPGKPAESELLTRLTAESPEERMPPASTGKTLTPAQIELFKRWIEQGAEFKGHWAYIAPTLSPVPQVDQPDFVRNDVDRFVLAELQEKGLVPSPAAERRVLIRRLFLDLLGLAPKPEDVEAFVADQSPDAYEKLVDHLLDSPHYGERMAMFWLDLVRYADTNGFHGDNHEDRDMYRDYVIAAFNTNKPFNQFTIEQLAGDLLPNATTEQRIASGYNRLLMTTREGGAQAKEYLAKYSADRVRNVSAVWMASTMGCCECHDHKFDPFLAKDFYSLASFFADIQETAVGEQTGTPIPTPQQVARQLEFDAKLAVLKEQLANPPEDLADDQAKWEKVATADLANNKPVWAVTKPLQSESVGKATLTIQEDQSVLSSGANPAKETYVVTLATELPRITGLRLEALTHPTLNKGGLSRSNGNFVLTGIEVAVSEPGQEQPRTIKIATGTADFEQGGFPIAHAFDDSPETGWAVGGYEKKENRQAAFVFAEPVVMTANSRLTIRLKHDSQYAQHNIGRFRLALTAGDKPTLQDQGLPDNVVAALKVSADQRTADQKQALADYYRTIDPGLNRLRKQLAQDEADQKEFQKTVRTTLVSTSGAPRMIRVLARGNWLDDSGEVVSPAIPQFLQPTPPAADRRQTRLDLAEWFVRRDNPLVARVMVNRLWKLTFGQGLVKSLEDFGAQGSWPTHPELLDWLALDFVDHGWDIKRTLKLLVMSGAYQQSSLVSDELKHIDPFNSWLARQGRFRLDAEIIRDNALATSGLLIHKLGGPSSKPYQPPGYWSHLNFPMREWQNDQGEGLYRRGLYTYWCRTFLHPSLKTFDAPTREECTVERTRSNTPLQALVLLNDPTYVEASRKLAERMLREGGPDINSRLQFAYQQLLSRPPRPDEIKILTEMYQKHLAEYQAEKPAADELLKIGAATASTDLDQAQLAATTSIARVLYNLHETITRN